MFKRMLVLSAFLGLTMTMNAGLIEPLLEEQMAKTDGTTRFGVMVVLNQQLDAERIINTIKDKEARWTTTVTELKSMARTTQAGLLDELDSRVAGQAVADVKPLWIVNAVYCEAVPEVVRALAARPEVWFVQWDLIPTENALCVAPADVTDGAYSVEWNVKQVKADSVWEIYGYMGENVIVGHIDTGCDYTHPDLVNRMWIDPNYPNHGWNFESNNNNPMDGGGHGTHTAGTVAGDGTGGDTTGMAPMATLMSCRTKTGIAQPFPDTIAENTMMHSMQFCVAPPLSPANHAHLLTFSIGWKHAWSPRRAVWRQAVTNVAAAGLPFFIAAGNDGAGAMPPDCITTPGDCPGPWKHPAEAPGGLGGAFTIGATDSNDSIASFSSRGPVKWDTIAPYNDYPLPPGLLRPDFSAPGVGVMSTRLGGGYQTMSGTSMATPCAAGVCALMLSKNPDLLPEEVDSIMQNSVLPIGTQPKNNEYGTGRIDAMLCIANTPGLVNKHDVRVLSTNISDRVRPDLPQTIRLTLMSRDYTEKDFHAFCTVESSGIEVYRDSMAIDSIAAHESRTFSFPSNWNVGPEHVTYRLRMWHDLGSDENRANDTLTAETVTHEQLRILLVYSDYAAPESTLGRRLAAHGDIVDYQDAEYSTPAVTKLLSYDAVGCHSMNAYQDSVLLGDNLAAYVDSGGGVVIGHRSFNLFTKLGGRIMTGDYATILAGADGMASTTLGWHNPASPLMQGVDSVREYYAATSGFAPGAESVACWQDGRPYVAVSANRKVVGLNQYPGVYLLNPPQRGGDWDLVWYNAFRYVSRRIAGTAEFDPFAPAPGITLSAAPNPAHGKVTVRYAIPAGGHANVTVFDRSGRLVKNLFSGTAGPGQNRMSWDMTDNQGRRVAAGVYFCRLAAAGQSLTKKLVIR